MSQFAVNPNPLPFNIPTWRIGDKVGLCDDKNEIVRRGRLIGYSSTSGMATVQMTDIDTIRFILSDDLEETLYIPLNVLFLYNG